MNTDIEMETPVYWKEIDRQIWEEELELFIPQRIFDIHTHIYDWAHTTHPHLEPEAWQEKMGKRFSLSSWEILNACDAVLLPGREIHRLAFPFPAPFKYCDFEKANHYAASQVSKDPQSASLMLVHPNMTAEELEPFIKKEGCIGFKPYRVYSVTGDTVECRITDFMPEHQLAVADRHGLIIMLHMAKKAAIADSENLADLERLTNSYPNVKWVLAHCARSYYDTPLLKAKKVLLKIPNLWYEISSVCDADAMDVLLSIAGPERVMYGSDDIPCGITRGKYITFGHGWAYLIEGNHKFDLSHCDPSMTFVRYEMLRAFCKAIRRHGYGEDETKNLFYGNATRLLSLVQDKSQGKRAKQWK